MSRLNELLRQLGTTNPALAADIQREVAALADRRAFGLNFERHMPEAVELPGRPVRKGDKVRVLPPRGENRTVENDRLWRVVRIDRSSSLQRAVVTDLADEKSTLEPAVDDLVVVAEFRDSIYPGLVSTGKVERGGAKPFHTVINAENYYALEAMLFTHRGKVDCIYIDPPYNTGARDWKYNNDYVEGDDLYRHSKWLAFMERRLLLAKQLLKPEDSVLIVTIDEKEYLRLGLLLEQVFPEARIQMVSIVINGQGSSRANAMSRVDEYAFFVYIGSARPAEVAIETLASDDNQSQVGQERIWFPLIRGGRSGVRSKSYESFYPVFVDRKTGYLAGCGEALPRDMDPEDFSQTPESCDAVWPISKEGVQGRWQMSVAEFRRRAVQGFIRVGARTRDGKWPVTYIREGTIGRIATGEILVEGKDGGGALVLSNNSDRPRGRTAKTVWYLKAHNSGTYGTDLLNSQIPGRIFPFPKSLYAVEDAIRYAVDSKRNAVVIDFFSGSGTTANAVMRLNRQDGGSRQSISITNNEVSSDEQKSLQERRLRPGDPDWEAHGICDYITKPRIRAAITGKTPEGEPIKGDYKFTDEFPMADGFEENVEFFTLTYESPLRVASNRDFQRIAPLLWLRAGARGRRIEELSKGWEVAEAYGVLANLDRMDEFVGALKTAADATVAFIVTDEDRLFETVVRDLPECVEPVRLYEAYLRNFEIEAGRSLR